MMAKGKGKEKGRKAKGRAEERTEEESSRRQKRGSVTNVANKDTWPGTAQSEKPGSQQAAQLFRQGRKAREKAEEKKARDSSSGPRPLSGVKCIQGRASRCGRAGTHNTCTKAKAHSHSLFHWFKTCKTCSKMARASTWYKKGR